jgi:hypothetical protein
MVSWPWQCFLKDNTRGVSMVKWTNGRMPRSNFRCEMGVVLKEAHMILESFILNCELHIFLGVAGVLKRC